MSTGSAVKAINPAAASPFANFSNGALADALGDLEATIELAQKRQKLARDEMTRRHANWLDGTRFSVAKATLDTHTLDAKAVRLEMGDAWYEARQKPGTRTTYTVTAKPLEQLGVSA